MIKVYVYVTGLVLYQFSANPLVPTRAILPSGGYQYPGLSDIPKHMITVNVGEFVGGIERDRLAIRFDGGCPPAGCEAPTPPEEIPDLDALMAAVGGSAALKNDCTTAEFKDKCRAPNSTLPAVNGLIEFAGNWTAEAYQDCSKDYPSPTETNSRATINFVHAGRAWDTLYDVLEKTGDSLPPPPVLNSVLFSTEVADVDAIKSIPLLGLDESLPIAGKLEAAAACAGMPGIGTAKHCLRVRITNGAETPEVGGADIHYAALYALMKTPPSATELLLPVAADGKACDGGGGCGGFNNCVGGKVKVKG